MKIDLPILQSILAIVAALLSVAVIYLRLYISTEMSKLQNNITTMLKQEYARSESLDLKIQAVVYRIDNIEKDIKRQ